MIKKLIPAAILTAFGMTAPAMAQPFHAIVHVNTPENVDVQLRLRPPTADVGQASHLYVFAALEGQGVWVQTPLGWELTSTEALTSLPAFENRRLEADQTITLVSGIDGVALAGTRLFAGYGQTAAEMLEKGQFNLVYTASALGRDDPLYSEQWHLRNTGQKAFSRSGGVPGEDLNVEPVHAKGILGQGVVVAVVDDGLEIAHSDLAANVIPNGSLNFITGSDDPSPTHPADAHGTSVAGLIGAVGWNGIGGRGVAPEVRLRGFNVLATQDEDTEEPLAAAEENFIYALGGGERVQDAAIFNQSFGSNQPLTLANEMTTGLFRHAVTTLRGGLGAVYIRSAGNSYNDLARNEDDVIISLQACSMAKSAGVGCGSAQFDPDRVLIEHIVIGALNANGVRASYSSPGANLLVTAPAGENGVTAPAMVTTDTSGCDMGYSMHSDHPRARPFNAGQDVWNNPKCDFNNDMNGTSSSAPNTSGAVALMLSANPRLSWRDVRDVLIRTARVVDADQPGVWVDLANPRYGEGGQGRFQAELPWITNAAGHRFHNWYGFGAVNADAAVTLAQNHTPMPPFRETAFIPSAENLAHSIPDFNADGASHRISMGEAMRIEAVQIEVDITHPTPSDLAIELISPSGTRSLLLHPLTGYGFFMSENLLGILASNAFYGETCQGEWTLKVTDIVQGFEGQLNQWRLRCQGH